MGPQAYCGAVVKLPRHFSGSAVADVIASAQGALRQGENALAFDFSDAEIIDSFGIGQLVSLAKDLRERNAKLTFKNLSEDMFQLFTDTGLDQIFAIQGVKQDSIDFFETSVDVRLAIAFEEEGDVCVFKMSGVMDGAGGARYFRQKFLLSLAKYRKLLLDFSELTFFDSLSISVLLDMFKLLKETGGQMRICGANYIIQDLFNTLNLSVVIPVFPSAGEALAEWK